MANKQKMLELTDALESGKYKQKRNSLYSEDCFCCLGVIADICGFKKCEHVGFLNSNNRTVNNNLKTLPEAMENFEIDSVGRFTDSGKTLFQTLFPLLPKSITCLAEFNDDLRSDFIMIANFIRAAVKEEEKGNLIFKVHIERPMLD